MCDWMVWFSHSLCNCVHDCQASLLALVSLIDCVFLLGLCQRTVRSTCYSDGTGYPFMCVQFY